MSRPAHAQVDQTALRPADDVAPGHRKFSRARRGRVSRRTFFSRAAAACAACFGAGAGTEFLHCAPQDQPVGEPSSHGESLYSGPILDTHQHLWDLRRFRLPWLERPKGRPNPLRRNFLMADYLKAAAGLNIVKTVYMEVDVDPSQHVAEAEWAIEMCQRTDNPMVAAVIGCQPRSREFGDYVRRFAGSPWVKGVRKVLHGLPPGVCLERQFVENMKLLGELGLRYDLCLRAGELLDAVRLVDQCPKTHFILDHCGNMSVQSTDKKLRARWRKGIRELADRPHVICKISGIVATARENWKPADLEPNINECLEAFGEDRVVFASDWPVCTRRATLRQWVNALKWIVRHRPLAFQRKLFHDNAVRHYALS